MSRFVPCTLAFIVGYLAGCGTYEYRKRPDASEVAVIRDIQNVFPEFANEVTSALEGLKALIGPTEGSLGRADIHNKIVRLYQEKDQLNAQLRDFVVARYQSYINAELDPDKVARERGRKNWNDVTAKVQEGALKLRQIKESIEQSLREKLEATEKVKTTLEQKIDSRNKVSKTGNEIETQVAGFFKGGQQSNKEKAVSLVRVAHGQLEDALRSDEAPKARAAADKIQTGVSNMWDPATSGQLPKKGEKAIELSNELRRRVDNYTTLSDRLREQQAKADEAEMRYAARLEEAINSMGAIKFE